MKNKLEYRIENGSLIIDNYFNNLKIGSINGGSVENILNKCKLYDEEYGTLLKENEYMKHIAKDFEQLQQENKKLNGAIQTYDILLKANAEENKQLQERIEYLERSNDRREDIIIEQRQEINNLEDNWDELKQENKQLKEELEWTIGIVEHNRIISKKNKEIYQLKDNWNKLKEYLINDINNRNGNRVIEIKKVGKVNKYEKGVEVSETISPIYTLMEDKSKTMKEVLNKMQELQGSDSNVKD